MSIAYREFILRACSEDIAMPEMCRYGRLWQAQGMRVFIGLVTYQHLFTISGCIVVIVVGVQDEDLHDHELIIIGNANHCPNNLVRAKYDAICPVIVIIFASSSSSFSSSSPSSSSLFSSLSSSSSSVTVVGQPRKWTLLPSTLTTVAM